MIDHIRAAVCAVCTDQWSRPTTKYEQAQPLLLQKRTADICQWPSASLSSVWSGMGAAVAQLLQDPPCTSVPPQRPSHTSNPGLCCIRCRRCLPPAHHAGHRRHQQLYKSSILPNVCQVPDQAPLTVWSPVMSILSSLGPKDTFTLQWHCERWFQSEGPVQSDTSTTSLVSSSCQRGLLTRC